MKRCVFLFFNDVNSICHLVGRTKQECRAGDFLLLTQVMVIQ